MPKLISASSTFRSSLPPFLGALCDRSIVGTAGSTICAFALASAVLLAGCRGGPESVENPAEVLSRTGQARERYFDALEAARMRGVDAPTKAALRRMVAADGYAIDARVMAFDLLLDTDRAALVEALGNSLPRMGDVAWRERVCELIGERKIEELVPALIRSWANPAPGMDPTKPRPERVAIAAIVGEDQIGATLIRTMREASPTTQANLRARCWELLMKLGDAPKLRAMLANPDATRGDGMLIDLARVSSELGVLPVTREEILWTRELCEPSRAEFFAEAREALAKLPEERRTSLEIRAIPVVVACAKRRPDLLTATDALIFDEVARRIAGRRKASPDFTGYGNGFTESLAQQRDVLVWSDLAAMAIALDMLAEPALCTHLFEQADRDREDRTTEYGGVLGLDDAGRAELLEFPPRSKASDVRFESPQALFDALYTRQFHYHNHTQKYDNSDYAGPHLGDFTFADSTRCNGLVFTFLSADLLGVDFYRHGNVVVDLGAIERPQG
jgi:hypothetical protein